MNRYILYSFYTFDMEKVNVFFHVYSKLMRDKIPRLGKAFDEFGIQISLFLFEWVIALFSNILSLDVSSRIWDQYLLFGDVHLMKVCLAMSFCLEKQLQEPSFETLVTMFKSVEKHITPANLFKAIDSDIKLKEKDYDNLWK